VFPDESRDTMNRKFHNERCPKCKQSVKRLLAALFGGVEVNWDLNIACRLDDYKNSKFYGDLEQIYAALLKHRGFDNFVKSKKLPRVDFFIPDQNVIVEFDESQHFTKPRDIALSLYPKNQDVGYSVERWRTLCQQLNKRDNDPPYRDEQRAWYDTLRDFAPSLLGSGQIVRLYSRDQIWCALNPESEADLKSLSRSF